MKVTSVGMIPTDWDVIQLADYIVDINDGPFGSNLKSEHYTPNREVRIIQLGNVGDNGWNDENVKYTTFEHASTLKRCIVPYGTVIVAKMMPAGRAIICPSSDPSYIQSSDVIKVVFSDSLDKDFFIYLTKSKTYLEQIEAGVQGSTRARTNIGKIKSIKLPLPPLREQQQIATALKAIDGLISSIDDAIAKKRQIKEGLMQQLLTGKTRLPGFSDDWVELRFDDFISRFATGLNPRSNFVLNVNASNYYITIKDFADGVLYFDQCDKVSDEAIKRINERSDLRKGDVLFSSIGRVGDAYVIEETPTNWNINESVFSLRPNHTIIDSRFLYYLIKSRDAQAKFQESITGTTLRSIKMGHLKEIACSFPSSIDEQRAIANALRSIDLELLSSESLREKYRLIKQGMMQELLTGKTRL